MKASTKAYSGKNGAARKNQEIKSLGGTAPEYPQWLH